MYDLCQSTEHNRNKMTNGELGMGVVSPPTILWVGVILIAVLGFFSHPACDELIFGLVSRVWLGVRLYLGFKYVG